MSRWMYGEPRDEGLNPVGLLRADPTFDVASDEHSDVVTSGGAARIWSSSGLEIVRLGGCRAEVEVKCEDKSSPSQDCVNTIRLDGRSFFCLTFFSVVEGVGLTEYDEGAVTAGPP